MRINHEGLELIKAFEGFKAKPYKCPADVPTIGYGATYYPNGDKVKMTDPPIDEWVATELLAVILEEFEGYVNSYVTSTLNDNQFSALVSFTYNLGPANLRSSTLLKKVNRDPNDPSIADEFAKWVKAGGKTLKGLVRRRKAEAELYFS